MAYNNLLGAFFSGKDGNSGYNQGYERRQLADYAKQTDPAMRQASLANLANVNPEASLKLQTAEDAHNEKIWTDRAKMFVSAPDTVKPQLWSRLLPEMRKHWAEAPEQYTQDLLPMIQEAAGVQNNVPSGARELQFLTKGFSPEDEVKARRVAAGLDPRISSAAIAYKVMKGSDGRERLVAVDPRTPGAIIIDGNNQPTETPKTPVFQDMTSTPIGTPAQVDDMVQKMIDSGMPRAEAIAFGQRQLARLEAATGMGNYQEAAAPPSQPSGAFVSRTPEEDAFAVQEAKNRSDLTYAPQIEGAKTQAQLSAELRGKPVLEAAVASAKIGGETSANLLADAPKAMQKSLQLFTLIDKAIKHPGREMATGASAVVPWDYAPGTDAKDFLTIQKQLEGKAFLEAFESLKGGGQITEVEGTKATQAMARLDRAQTEKSYVEALNELKLIAAMAYKRAKDRLKTTPPPPPPASDGWSYGGVKK